MPFSLMEKTDDGCSFFHIDHPFGLNISISKRVSVVFHVFHKLKIRKRSLNPLFRRYYSEIILRRFYFRINGIVCVCLLKYKRNEQHIKVIFIRNCIYFFNVYSALCIHCSFFFFRLFVDAKK